MIDFGSEASLPELEAHQSGDADATHILLHAHQAKTASPVSKIHVYSNLSCLPPRPFYFCEHLYIRQLQMLTLLTQYDNVDPMSPVLHFNPNATDGSKYLPYHGLSSGHAHAMHSA